MTSWLGVTSPGEKGGSFLTKAVDFLTGVEFLLVVFVIFYPPSLFCRNSWMRKSRIELWLPLIYSISKSKTLNIDYQRAKPCFDAMF